MTRGPHRLLLFACLLGCGGGDPPADASTERDAGADAAPDAGANDAGTDDAGTDSGWDYWDGVTVPEPIWTLPACAVGHGIIERRVFDLSSSPDLPSPARLGPVAAGDGRAVVTGSGPSSRWGEVDTGGYQPLPDGPAGYPPRAMGLEIVGGSVLAVDLGPAPGGLQIVEATASDTTAHEIELGIRSARLEPPWWIGRSSDSSLALVGPLDSWDGFGNRLSLLWTTPAFEVVELPQTLSTEEFTSEDLLTVLPHEGGWLAVRTLLPYGADLWYPGLELIAFDETGVVRTQVLRARPSWSEIGISHVAAARDGDVAVIVWSSGRVHPPGFYLAAEVDLETGAVLAEPYMIDPFAGGPPIRGSPPALTSTPGSGVDIVHNPDNPDWVFNDELLNTDNPLDVYIGLERPISLEGREPLRLGAGAWSWRVRTARDGDRLVVVWDEEGPMTEPDRDRRWSAVQGLYWAILEGCAPTP